MEPSSNGRNGKRSASSNEDPTLLGGRLATLPGEGSGNGHSGLQPQETPEGRGDSAGAAATDASALGTATTFDRVRNALKAATTHLGNALDGSLARHPTLWAIWSRRETEKGRKLKPARIVLTPIASGIEATLDDDELGYTFTVSATLVADVYGLLNDCIEGRSGSIKEKTRGSAARKAAEAAKKVIEQEVRAEVNRRMS